MDRNETHARLARRSVSRPQLSVFVATPDLTSTVDHGVSERPSQLVARVAEASAKDTLLERCYMDNNERETYARMIESQSRDEPSVKTTPVSVNSATSAPDLTLTLPSIMSFAQPTSTTANVVLADCN